ncbi:multiple sugar transport system substrate-binding protein [Okibacterium sp. HSC-33S16]|uniref:sugar ABC transporter substrate-binding protein n=1 Tax=Okibacterium sp. HSC-33S16 TaxID=2910965 RepID=UPI00209FB3D7|nr:ABC transporter substrate-binding protein [Okibacterium sp. HSC-33S16]MCP2031037.1 multiple sugar transport system substrate-binding protein [Okibacterium sp. HSC-33S16]
MKKRRLTTLLAIAAITPLALTACGSGGGGAKSGGDPDTLTVLDYYNNEPDKTLIQAAIDKCAEALDVKVKRETVPGKDLIQKVLQRSSSKTLPDVLMLDNPDLQEIAATGGLSPLSDYDIDTSGFAEGILDAATYEDEVYGLAPTVNTLGLFYNEDLLAAAGIQPPTTWDELKTAASALTTGDQYGLAFSAIATYEGSWQFLPFMWTNGGDETELETPEVAEALQLWVDLVDSGASSKSVLNWSQADVKDQFVAGKAAMMINGPWQIPALAESPDVKWGAVQVPVNEIGQTPIAPLGGEVWTVPVTGNDEKQGKAASFVECISSDDNQLELATQRFTVPTKTALADEYVEAVPTMEAFTEQVANARSRTGQLGEEWPEAATVIYTAIQLALTGQASVEDAFAQASAG